MFDDFYYEIAVVVVLPTVVGDLVLPSVLLLFLLLLKGAGDAPPENFQSGLTRAWVAWVLSLTWRFGHIEPIYSQLSQFAIFRDFSLSPLIASFLLINTVMLHFYVILSLLTLLCRFWWRPVVPLLSSRAYPILITSTALAFALGLYLRYAILPQNRETFTPAWYFYYGIFLFAVVAGIPRLQTIANVTPRNALSVLDPASSEFFLTRLWKAIAGHETKSSVEYSNPSAVSSNGNQLIVPEPAGDLFVPSEGPTQTAYIRLRRSQRSTAFRGTILFALDARIEVPAEQRSLISKYRLDDAVVYDSEDRQRYTESANAHLESTREHPSLLASPKDQLLGVGKTLYRFGRASFSAVRAGLSLRVTIHSLLAGVHVECKSMQELLEAENAIVSAAQNLKSYLETAATFDGREEIIEL